MRNLIIYGILYLLSILFLWWFYDDFLMTKFNLPELSYYEVLAIHLVFRVYFFATPNKNTDIKLGNFETKNLNDFFNIIKKR